MKAAKTLLWASILFFGLKSQAQTSIFPAFEAKDLNRKTVNIPADIYAPKTLLIVPFQQAHQTEINSFLAQIATVLQANTEFDYLEIPTISHFWTWFGMNEWFIDNGMRSGIQEFEARKRTITRYIDVNDFLTQMQLPNKDKVAYFLIDKTGKIYWQKVGNSSAKDIADLENVLLKMEN